MRMCMFTHVGDMTLYSHMWMLGTRPADVVTCMDAGNTHLVQSIHFLDQVKSIDALAFCNIYRLQRACHTERVMHSAFKHYM